MGTVGPGSIQLLNGLSAPRNRLLLATYGQVPSAEIGTKFFEEVNNDRLFADIAAFTQTTTSARCHWLGRQRKGADPEYGHYPVGRIRKHLDNPTHTIRPELAAAAVNELATEAAIFTSDSKISTARLHHSRRLLGSFNLGSMANAMQQTLDAAKRNRDRQVIGSAVMAAPRRSWAT